MVGDGHNPERPPKTPPTDRFAIASPTEEGPSKEKPAWIAPRGLLLRRREGVVYRAPTGFFGIGIKPSRWARLRASLRARRTASAF